MIVPGSANALMLGQSQGYNLTKSLRFRSSASAYLNRTPASASNRKTFTWSGWIKLSLLNQYGANFAVGNNNFNIKLSGAGGSTNSLEIYQYNGSGYDFQLISSATYRDPSAWYHLVVAFDTTQGTASNRIKVYVNGSQVTSFSTANYPSSSFDTYVNSTNPHYHGIFGSSYTSSTYVFDGYMTEINFIDGQQLTPSSFGSTNATTGVWQPAKYTGTYGTNGFYLPFTNTTSTTTLGYDFSGNSNNWTVNNISLTAGSTYDSMTDVPTLTSASASNFAVFNPLVNSPNPNGTLTNGNLLYTGNAASSSTYGTIAVTSGKFYFETTMQGIPSSPTAFIGIAPYPYSSTYLRAYRYNDGQYFDGSAWASYGATFTTGDVIGCAFDMDSQTITFYKNGVSQGTKSSIGLSGQTIQPFFFINSSPGAFSVNFGQQPFSYTPPTGYLALNTYNLPTSTIVQGNKYMDATLYTGNGSSLSVTNTAGFKPDLVWAKCRSSAYNNVLNDSVRGISKWLISDTTDAELSSAGYGVTAFNSNGFTVGLGTSFNNNTSTYVGWQWQAGQGTTSSNTNGSITSTVSVNASAGFSVATFTSPASGTCSFGHGLGVTPAFVIVKSRASGNWICEHTSTGTQYLLLNSTSAATTDSSVFNSAPTSSVVNLGTGFSGSVNYVAYCWAEIAGFSKFGSYTGNGSADGPFVYTGFRPKFVMTKCSSTTGEWVMLDTSRSPYNAEQLYLYADASSAEAGSFDVIDGLSNGFKVRSTWSQNNTNGATYIYMAFAENPFKNALAR